LEFVQEGEQPNDSRTINIIWSPTSSACSSRWRG